jgi:hypothetical protein
MNLHPNGHGYWEFASDGGVFTFDPGAKFQGSTGNFTLVAPMVSSSAT